MENSLSDDLEPKFKIIDDEPSNMLFDALDVKFNAKRKTDGHEVVAARILEGSVGFARRILGFTNVGAGDYVVKTGRTSFYITKRNFEKLYEEVI